MAAKKETEIFEPEVLESFSEPIVQEELFETDEVSSISDKSLVKIYEGTLADSTELSLKSQRLFRVIVSLVKPTDVNNKTYAFNVADYQKLYGMSDYPKKQLLDASDELTKAKLIPYKDSPKDFTRTGLITYFDVKDGVVTFGIAPRLLPYYKLAKEKQQYMLGNTKKFESSHSFFFYELFLVKLTENTTPDNENEVEFYLTLGELREILKLGNTYVNKKTGVFSYGSFNNRVLKPVYEDINKKIEDNPVCNINFEYIPQKAGRSVVGLNFKVWRVRLDVDEEPVLNIFYEALENDVKLGYDALLGLGMKKADIEKCILTYKEDRFRKIVKYIHSVKYKGSGYIAAIMKNGWTDNNSSGTDDFINIGKCYNISPKEMEFLSEIEAFLALQDSASKEKIHRTVVDASKTSPQLVKHFQDLTLDQILETRDIKTLYIDRIKDIIMNSKESELSVRFNEYRDNEDNIEEIIKGREQIIEVFKKRNINKNAWKEILKYSDEYILANIQYCVSKYEVGKKQKDIGGAIISAINNDYAGYNVKAKEAELALKKQNEYKEFEESIKAMSIGELQQADKYSSEEKPIVEKEIKARQQQQAKEADDAFEIMYDTFIEEGTEEDKETYKRKALDNMVAFARQTLAKTLKLTEKDLPEVPVERLLKSAVFIPFFKSTVRKEFGL